MAVLAASSASFLAPPSVRYHPAPRLTNVMLVPAGHSSVLDAEDAALSKYMAVAPVPDRLRRTEAATYVLAVEKPTSTLVPLTTRAPATVAALSLVPSAVEHAAEYEGALSSSTQLSPSYTNVSVASAPQRTGLAAEAASFWFHTGFAPPPLTFRVGALAVFAFENFTAILAPV